MEDNFLLPLSSGTTAHCRFCSIFPSLLIPIAIPVWIVVIYPISNLGIPRNGKEPNFFPLAAIAHRIAPVSLYIQHFTAARFLRNQIRKRRNFQLSESHPPKVGKTFIRIYDTKLIKLLFNDIVYLEADSSRSCPVRRLYSSKKQAECHANHCKQHKNTRYCPYAFCFFSFHTHFLLTFDIYVNSSNTKPPHTFI